MNRKVLPVLLAALFLLTGTLARFAHPSLAAQNMSVYLPLVMRDFPPPPTVFGVETVTFDDPTLIQLTVDAHVSWVRIPAFYWHNIEPTAPVNGQHTYDWSSVPESSLLNIAANHMYAIATVRSTPLWAQSSPNVYCSSVKQENLNDFAAFLQAAVERYSKPPYNVHYWELGNEPDIDPSIVPFKDSGIMGCWGDESDAYYGGGYYADMLKVVYPAIKAADPQAQVLIGGLLLDCDPDDPDCPGQKKIPPKFFEGILRNGGGEYFDIVSFHGYPPYASGLIQDEIYTAWDQRGGVVLGKADYLHSLMQQYGVDKPLLHTEGALLCPEWNQTDCNPPTTAYEEAKADYVVWLYTRALAQDFMGSIWYTLDGGGWRNGGLLDEGTSTPTTAYQAFQFITTELAEAQYTGTPSGLDPALRGYAFQVPGKTVWVLWSADNAPHAFPTPAGYTAVYDKLGTSQVLTSTMQINSPVYIELP